MNKAPGVPVEDRAYANWKRINPKAKKHKCIVIEPGVHAFFDKLPEDILPNTATGYFKGVVKRLTRGGRAEYAAKLIGHIQEQRENKDSHVNKGAGASVNVDYYYKILRPLERHVQESPAAVGKGFKKDLAAAMTLLRANRGNSITAVTKGVMPPEEIYAVAYHELSHSYVDDFVGKFDARKREEARTNEGLATYLQIAHSGVYHGQRFEDAVKREMAPRLKELYGEPAMMLHKMLSKGKTITSDFVDENKLIGLLKEVKKGKSLDELYAERMKKTLLNEAKPRAQVATE